MTRVTAEIQTMPVVIGGVPTPGTPFAGVLRINIDDLEAYSFGFIPNKLFQLSKAPPVQVGALLFPKASAVPNAFQVFQRNRRVPGLCGTVDNLLANDVVGVAGTPCLSPGQPLEHPTNATSRMRCLVPLEIRTNEGIPSTKMFRIATPEEPLLLAVGDGRQVIDPPIDTDDSVIGVVNDRNLSFEGDGQVHLPVLEEESSIPTSPVGQIPGDVGFPLEGDPLDPSVKGTETQSFRLKRDISSTNATLQDDSIVPKADGRFDGLLGRMESQVVPGDMPDGIGGDLRRQAEPVTDISIDQSMQCDRVALTSSGKGYSTHIVTGVCPCLNGPLSHSQGQGDLEFRGTSNFHSI
jgi:hypothetical protein